MERLIDADELQKSFDEYCACECAVCIYSKKGLPCKLIDLAPEALNSSEKFLRGWDAGEAWARKNG